MKNRKTIGIISLFVVPLFVLNACFYDQVIPVEQPVEDVGDVTYAADIIPIFNASCNTSGCHSAGGQNPNLTAQSAYTSLTNGGYINTTDPESSELYLWMRGVKGTPMPVSGSDATYNAKVLKWIELGALNN